MHVVAWRALAHRRILSILSKRRVASLRQLESKISEAGPHNIRPEPHHVKPALDQLLVEKLVFPVSQVSIGQTPTQLYAHHSFDLTLPSDAERLRYIETSYKAYQHIALPRTAVAHSNSLFMRQSRK